MAKVYQLPTYGRSQQNYNCGQEQELQWGKSSLGTFLVSLLPLSILDGIDATCYKISICSTTNKQNHLIVSECVKDSSYVGRGLYVHFVGEAAHRGTGHWHPVSVRPGSDPTLRLYTGV